ncbi:MAG: hypothetical protein KDK53_07420 [Maritimibacter sp.]|nr:hypothetical protein [Maritimibacter sp.]
MKIECSCGCLIHDGTDNLPHKAHLIPDRDWDAFWAAVDAAVETAPATEATVMGLRWARLSRAAWECAACGRLWIDRRDGTLQSYRPDNGTPNGILA